MLNVITNIRTLKYICIFAKKIKQEYGTSKNKGLSDKGFRRVYVNIKITIREERNVPSKPNRAPRPQGI